MDQKQNTLLSVYIEAIWIWIYANGAVSDWQEYTKYFRQL